MTNQQIQLTKDSVRPWAIVRLLPNAQCYTVARFYNRQDAQDHRRFLHRWMPAADFEIVFDVPVEDN
jgi:putative acetyltransferase